jgi:hypothetical protein
MCSSTLVQRVLRNTLPRSLPPPRPPSMSVPLFAAGPCTRSCRRNPTEMPSATYVLMSVLLALVSSAAAAPTLSQRDDASKTWALLVAGSDTFSNYR